jgi:hypothetical protein
LSAGTSHLTAICALSVKLLKRFICGRLLLSAFLRF